MNRKQPCPCHSGRAYGKCCRPLHRGGPRTPEALMRSRFAAYALGKTRYIMETTHTPREDVDAWRAEIRSFCANTAFLGLSIDGVEPGDREAFVTFTATLEQNGRDMGFTERSRFLRTDAWRYADGERQ